MELTGFRIQMYKCVIDSGRIEVSPLTVLVGKNESGKTSLLKALHKFNPFNPEPYSMDREWPRGHRNQRDDEQTVCTGRFKLVQKEIDDLKSITDQLVTIETIEVTRDYAGRLEVVFPEGMFPEKLHPNEVDEICSILPNPSEPVGEDFQKRVESCHEEIRRLANEGRFEELGKLEGSHKEALESSFTTGNPNPQHQHESTYVNTHTTKLREIRKKLSEANSIHTKAHEYIVENLPTFIYMDEYRAFQGSAFLDQVLQRQKDKKLTEEDRTLLMIMKLSGLGLESEVEKGKQTDREQRQYDLDDAGATLTNEIRDRWKQLKYEVKFGADGHQFFTFVKDEKDRALIKLEERSKGFQWFFSFDLMFMYESQGTFKGCIILLDEPGLHLHPEGQRNLLERMEKYAEGNTLIYSTHLPFMIDLRKPERIRILNEGATGTVVSENLYETSPEAKLTLQAALGISGSSSYLVAQRNLVVEGVDDFWVVTEFSNLLSRSGKDGLREDIYITAAGGASEAAYIATFMIGQKLQVVVLLDSDHAGDEAKDALVKKWLSRYQKNPALVLSLGAVVNEREREYSIEDLFPDDFYLERVKQVYEKQLIAVGNPSIVLRGNGQLCKRVENALGEVGITFNKGSVAKLIRRALSQMKSIDELPKQSQEKATKLIAELNDAFRRLE